MLEVSYALSRMKLRSSMPGLVVTKKGSGEGLSGALNISLR